MAYFTPNVSMRTLAIVAAQLVVHEPTEIILCDGLSQASLTPGTMVTSGLFAGAVITTFFAPAFI